MKQAEHYPVCSVTHGGTASPPLPSPQPLPTGPTEGGPSSQQISEGRAGAGTSRLEDVQTFQQSLMGVGQSISRTLFFLRHALGMCILQRLGETLMDIPGKDGIRNADCSVEQWCWR
ncbi:hypothetical protein CRENBAI_015575 [Crenichthys baileyi]|uniref:Uncharacterized protein n=1 Tax=Crenichthys baileyi TaxID=28760 RepID=A0AAV9R5I7_9TELE